MPGYVQKLRALVRILLAGDEPTDGVLCLAPYARFHDGPQTLLELLNGADRFIPLEVPEDGSVRLVTRTEIMYVAPHAGVEARLQRHTSFQITHEEQVRMTMVDGTFLEGLLQLELPNELNRASDYLNLADDFFTLETGEGLLLVNKLRVREVRVFVASPMPAEQD